MSVRDRDRLRPAVRPTEQDHQAELGIDATSNDELVPGLITMCCTVAPWNLSAPIFSRTEDRFLRERDEQPLHPRGPALLLRHLKTDGTSNIDSFALGARNPVYPRLGCRKARAFVLTLPR